MAVLLEKGAAISPRSSDGVTPLFMAAQDGHKEVVELLVKKGAPVNQACDDGYHPPHTRSHHHHAHRSPSGWIFRSLFRIITPLELQPFFILPRRETPLYTAAKGGHKDTVLFLLGEGAVIKARRTGRTPLHVAAYAGHTKVVEILLAAGADRSKKDITGTALDNARKQNHSAVAKLLACVEVPGAKDCTAM